MGLVIVTIFPFLQHRFDHSSSHMEFVAGKVAQGGIFTEYLGFSCQFACHQHPTSIDYLFCHQSHIVLIVPMPLKTTKHLSTILVDANEEF
jgi:hypothetical protein